MKKILLTEKNLLCTAEFLIFGEFFKKGIDFMKKTSYNG